MCIASRKGALLDIMLNDDDSLLNLGCAKCKQRVESLETAMINLTTKFKRSVAVLQSELRYTPLYYPDKYTILSLNSDVTYNTEESENTPESPYLGEIKRMHKQCVPGVSPFFARARTRI